MIEAPAHHQAIADTIVVENTETAAIRAVLSNPATYGVDGTVEVIETHMSWVFLAGDEVYKIKKRIRLAFADYRELAARRLNCRREVEINQELAPGVYLRLASLTREPDGNVALDGSGKVIDWAVVMRRLDRDLMLDQRIRRNIVRPADIDRLGELLGPFYRTRPQAWRSPQAHVEWWRRHVTLNAASLGDTRFDLPASQVRHLIEAETAFIDTLGSMLEARAASGAIIDCHGDLRPEHVYVGEKIFAIDRLEFDPELRWLDPFDEAMLLGVECERMGAAWIGCHFTSVVTRYLEIAPPDVLIAFYACDRALMRARLSIEHLRDPSPQTPDRWPRQTREYLDIAERYAQAWST